MQTPQTHPSRATLLASLEAARVLSRDDAEVGHYDADMALLHFINDAEVTAAFEAVGRWYA